MRLSVYAEANDAQSAPTCGGARKGAGRKPKPLAEKLAAGNPGHRPLKKLEFNGKGGFKQPEPPEYLSIMVKRTPNVPTPMDIFNDTVKYLEPSDCLNLIPSALIADYAMANTNLKLKQPGVPGKQWFSTFWGGENTSCAKSRKGFGKKQPQLSFGKLQV